MFSLNIFRVKVKFHNFRIVQCLMLIKSMHLYITSCYIYRIINKLSTKRKHFEAFGGRGGRGGRGGFSGAGAKRGKNN